MRCSGLEDCLIMGCEGVIAGRKGLQDQNEFGWDASSVVDDSRGEMNELLSVVCVELGEWNDER